MNKKIESVRIEDDQKTEQQNKQMDKNTKQKSNAQKLVPVLIVAIVSLLVILTCVLIAYYQIYTSSKKNANILEGVYASSYYSMVDNVNNLAVDVAKYSSLTTKQAKLKTMQDITEDCNYILAGLSVLPINKENVVDATKFFNQVAGVCDAYTKQLDSGKNLTQEQELVFDKIALVVGKIKANFNAQNYGMYDSGFNFVDASYFDKTGMNELSTSLGDLSADNVEYPSMIFDGPFSTSLETKEVKGLKGKEISEDEAKNYLENTVYKNRDVKIDFEKETNGQIATYDFTVQVEGKKFYCQVSKVGCLLITLSGYAEAGDPIMEPEQAISLSENFANNIGFENMQCVWKELHDNVLYVNLAPVVSNVIYYPDLVKVKVDLTAQDIIGVEAQNYAFNYTSRSFEFVLSDSDCESVLGFDYEILSTSKAVIRLDGGTEVAVHEFVLDRIDGMYFYYVNANTMKIEKIMKLVDLNGVEKLI